MTKLLATCAAVAFSAAFAMPASADTSKRSDGVRNVTEQTDVSAQRRRGHVHRHHRHHRHVHRHYAPRYGYYRPHYYDAPYYAYGPRYRYYRPYYGPRVGFGIGPFGFGVW